MYISLKGLEKGRPVGRSDLSISNTRFFQPLFWLHNSRQVPLAPHMGDHFPAFLIPGINQPGLVALLANKCPEFIHLQRLIMCAFGTGLMRAAQGCQNLAAAVAGDGADVAYAAAAGGHLSDQPVCTGMAAPVVDDVVADKLPAAVLAEVFLLVVAGFAVSLYILSTATGTANSNLSLHNPNILCFRCLLCARYVPAYILGHHQFLLR